MPARLPTGSRSGWTGASRRGFPAAPDGVDRRARASLRPPPRGGKASSRPPPRGGNAASGRQAAVLKEAPATRRRRRRHAALQLALALLVRARACFCCARRAANGSGLFAMAFATACCRSDGAAAAKPWRRRELLEEVRLGGAQLVSLRALAGFSVRPILREFSFVVVLLLLARRGRLAHFFNIRRLLLDARAALGGALREALGSGLRHGLLSRYRGSIGCPEATGRRRCLHVEARSDAATVQRFQASDRCRCDGTAQIGRPTADLPKPALAARIPLGSVRRRTVASAAGWFGKRLAGRSASDNYASRRAWYPRPRLLPDAKEARAGARKMSCPSLRPTASTL